MAFNVLGAWGDEAGSDGGQAWRCGLPTATRRDRVGLLRSLPGQPVLVVCDGAEAISKAVAEVWPGAFVERCGHHLREKVRKQVSEYGQIVHGSKGVTPLIDAFRTLGGWRAFKKWIRDSVQVDA